MTAKDKERLAHRMSLYARGEAVGGLLGAINSLPPQESGEVLLAYGLSRFADMLSVILRASTTGLARKNAAVNFPSARWPADVEEVTPALDPQETPRNVLFARGGLTITRSGMHADPSIFRHPEIRGTPMMSFKTQGHEFIPYISNPFSDRDFTGKSTDEREAYRPLLVGLRCKGLAWIVGYPIIEGTTGFAASDVVVGRSCYFATFTKLIEDMLEEEPLRYEAVVPPVAPGEVPVETMKPLRLTAASAIGQLDDYRGVMPYFIAIDAAKGKDAATYNDRLKITMDNGLIAGMRRWDERSVSFRFPAYGVEYEKEIFYTLPGQLFVGPSELSLLSLDGNRYYHPHNHNGLCLSHGGTLTNVISIYVRMMAAFDPEELGRWLYMFITTSNRADGYKIPALYETVVAAENASWGRTAKLSEFVPLDAHDPRVRRRQREVAERAEKRRVEDVAAKAGLAATAGPTLPPNGVLPQHPGDPMVPFGRCGQGDLVGQHAALPTGGCSGTLDLRTLPNYIELMAAAGYAPWDRGPRVEERDLDNDVEDDNEWEPPLADDLAGERDRDDA